jgi:hypothetical protein
MNRFPNNIQESNVFPTGLYNGAGYNSNNFNKRSMPSNVYPMNGANTGNPVGRFNPMTTNAEYNTNATNFTQAFEQNNPLIEKIDYVNHNKVLHNNIGDNVLDEHVVEYKLHIDSLDRDIRYYPNPFSFIVKFNPEADTIVQTEEYISYKNKNKGTHIVETKFRGPPTPHINKQFKNIKYVKLESIILPQYGQIKEDENGVWVFDPQGSIVTDRFTSLVIDELNCDRIFTTSEGQIRTDENGKTYNPPVPFSNIFLDKLLGLVYFSGTPYFGNKIYKNSLLGNLGQMTINLYNSCGELLQYTDQFTFEQLQEYKRINGEPLPITDLRHPYNKKTQIYMTFIIGVIESQVNTNTKFDL